MTICYEREKPNDISFLDSGCSSHMSGGISSFRELDEAKKLEVTLGDNKKIQVECRGTVSLAKVTLKFCKT